MRPRVFARREKPRRQEDISQVVGFEVWISVWGVPLGELWFHAETCGDGLGDLGSKIFVEEFSPPGGCLRFRWRVVTVVEVLTR